MKKMKEGRGADLDNRIISPERFSREYSNG
jgi:hypothetical protein